MEEVDDILYLVLRRPGGVMHRPRHPDWGRSMPGL